MASENRVKTKLSEGRLAVGLTLRIAPTVEMTLVARQAGFDWLFLDMEHGPLAVHQIGQVAIAAASAGLAPIARVTHQDLATAARLLDAGVHGLVFPHVDDAAEASAAAAACRFTPAGTRSYGGVPPSLGFASMPVPEVMWRANDITFVVVMIETAKAVANADAIAAVPGVDCLLIGSNDLCLDLGIPGQFGDPKVVAAYEAVIGACRRHGKWPGMGGIYDTTHAKTYVQMGARFILGGSDLAFISAGAKARVDFFSSCL